MAQILSVSNSTVSIINCEVIYVLFFIIRQFLFGFGVEFSWLNYWIMNLFSIREGLCCKGIIDVYYYYFFNDFEFLKVKLMWNLVVDLMLNLLCMCLNVLFDRNSSISVRFWSEFSWVKCEVLSLISNREHSGCKGSIDVYFVKIVSFIRWNWC